MCRDLGVACKVVEGPKASPLRELLLEADFLREPVGRAATKNVLHGVIESRGVQVKNVERVVERAEQRRSAWRRAAIASSSSSNIWRGLYPAASRVASSLQDVATTLEARNARCASSSSAS